MKLLTAEVIRKLERAPMMSTDGQDIAPVIVKFFTPDSSWTWYVLEGEKTEDGDWEFFGLVDGHEKELGYFRLSELQSARGPLHLPIERDMHFSKHAIKKSTREVI